MERIPHARCRAERRRCLVRCPRERGELPIREYTAIERDLSGSVDSYLVREPKSTKLREEGKSLLFTRDAATGERTIRILRRDQVDALFATVERRNELRQAKRGPLVGQPPIQPPMETP